MTDTPIRERLAVAMLTQTPKSPYFGAKHISESLLETALGHVDAILAELQEPSEDTLRKFFNTGNAHACVMHTKEFMTKRRKQVDPEDSVTDEEAAQAFYLAVYWGWRQTIQHIRDGGS